MDEIVVARPLQDGKTHRSVQAACMHKSLPSVVRAWEGPLYQANAHFRLLFFFLFAIFASLRVFIWIIHGRGSYEIASHADIRR